jgi:hypothetical protein
MTYKIQLHKVRNCDVEKASPKQIKFLRSLCHARDIQIPECNLKQHLTKRNAMFAIRHLLEGDEIEFMSFTS